MNTCLGNVSATFCPSVEGLCLEFLCTTSQLTIMSHLHGDLCLGFQLLLHEDQLLDYLDMLTTLVIDHPASTDPIAHDSAHTFIAGMTCYPRYVDGEWVDDQLMLSVFLGDQSGKRIDICTLTPSQHGFNTSNCVTTAQVAFSWHEFQQYVSRLQSIHANLPAYREHYRANPDGFLIESTVHIDIDSEV